MDYKSFDQIPKASPTPVSSKSSPKVFTKSLSQSLERLFPVRAKRELIAGGDIKWKPVDKPAAMLLAKAPDICKPKLTPQAMPKERPISSVEFNEKDDNTALDNKIIKEAQQLPAKLTEHLDLLRAAKASLEIGTDMFRKDMIDFMEELPKHIKTMRDWRMTMDRERDLSLRALRDLRQFFLEADHEKEMMRLNEFVRMCERLRDLSLDGTLGKVADVMLKLAVP